MLTASKTKYGHCEANAGGISVIETLDMLKEGYLKPLLHFKLLNPKIKNQLKDGFKINLPIVGIENNYRKILINSFGFSGTNTSIVLEKLLSPPKVNKKLLIQSNELLLISAKSEESFNKILSNINLFISSHIAYIDDIFLLLQKTRSHFVYRSAQIFNRIDNSYETLKSNKNNKETQLCLVIDKIEYIEVIINELLNNHCGFFKIWNDIKNMYFNFKNFYIKFEICFVKFLLDCNLPIKEIIIAENNLIIKKFFTNYNGIILKTLNKVKINENALYLSNFFKSDNRPSYLINKLIGEFYLKNAEINFDVFNPRPINTSIILPKYLFDRKYFWPFKEEKHKNKHVNKFNNVISNIQFQKYAMKNFKKEIFFKSQYKKISNQNLFSIISNEIYFSIINFCSETHILKIKKIYSNILYDIENKEDNIEKIIEDLICNKINSIVIHWKDSNEENIDKCIKNLILLSQFISKWPREKLIKLIVIVNQSEKSVLTSFTRTSATEYSNLCYKILHFENNINLLKLNYLEEFIVKEFESLKDPSKSEILLVKTNRDILRQKLTNFFTEKTTAYNIDKNILTKIRGKILITGGTGGIGQFLIENIDANEFLVVSRSNNKKLEIPGKTIKFYSADCSNYEKIDIIFANESPIDIIIHAAGIVKNTLLKNLNKEIFEKVFQSKVYGTKNLLKLAIKYKTQHFVAISSAATIIGSFGQSNYVVANYFMEKICKTYNDSIKTSIYSFGPFDTIGMLAGDRLSPIRQQIQDGGWNFLNSNVALKYLIQNIEKAQNVIIFDGNWSVIKKLQKHLTIFLEDIGMISQNVESCLISNIQHNPNFFLPVEIETIIRQITQIKSKINPNVGIMSYGIDSLMLDEIRHLISEKYQIKINPAEMYEYVTIDRICDLVQIKIKENFLNSNVEKNDFKKKILKDQETINIVLTNKSKINSKIDLPQEKEIFKENSDNSLVNIEIKSKKIKKKIKFLKTLEYTKLLNENDVAIISIVGQFSGSDSIEYLWENILNKKELLNKKERFIESSNNSDNDKNDKASLNNQKIFVPVSGIIPEKCLKFDAHLFNLSNDDAICLDPQIRLFLQNSYTCLEKSGYIKQIDKLKIGCLLGAEPSDYLYNNDNNYHKGSLIDMYLKNQKDFCAMWTSHLLNITGPSGSVYSACSSSLLAINQSIELIKSGKVDLCLSGAAHLILPNNIGHDYVPGMVLSSKNYCRPFSNNPKVGIIRGSGCGVVLLKNALKAFKDNDQILAVIKSCVINNDGGLDKKSNFLAPSVQGQREVINAALKEANIIFDNLTYMECHATGTSMGDNIELKAISDLINKQKACKKLRIGSIKANIGHAFAASGMAAISKCIKILETKCIPPQLKEPEMFNLLEDHPGIFEIQEEKETINLDENLPIYIAINNFGIGGTNGCMVLMEGPNRFSNTNKNIFNNNKSLITGNQVILPISAVSADSCVSLCHQISDYLNFTFNKSSSKCLLQNVAYTLQNHRIFYPYRTFVIASDLNEAIHKLKFIEKNDIIYTFKKITTDSLAYFFCPQGVQYPKMLDIELNNSKELKKNLEKICANFKGNNLLQILNSDDINQTKYAQCGLLAITQVITNFIQESGIQIPNIVFGHSLGEYLALVEAGALNVKECMKLLNKRGELVSTTDEAKLILVYEDIDKIIIPKDLQLSAKLSNKIHVFVGEASTVDTFVEYLKNINIEYKLIKGSYGFHSKFLNPILEEFRKHLKEYNFKPLNKNVISNVNGNFLKSEELNENYLCNHLIKPVRIDLNIETIIKKTNISTIVEIGPPGMLINLLKQQNCNINVIHTMKSQVDFMKNKSEITLFTAICKLWTLGYNVNFQRLCGIAKFDYNMPTYQFDRIEFPLLSKNINSFEKIVKMKIFKQNWKTINTEKNSFILTNNISIGKDLCITNNLTTINEIFINSLMFKVELTVLNFSTFIENSSTNEIKMSLLNKNFTKLKKLLPNLNNIYIIIDFNDIKENNFLQYTFYLINKIEMSFLPSKQPLKISVMAVNCIANKLASAYFSTVYAPLTTIKNLDNRIKISVFEVDTIKSLQNFVDFIQENSNLLGFNVYKIKNGILHEMFYEIYPLFYKINDLTFKQKICIIFGGTGTIGKTFTKVLNKLYSNIKLYFVSKNAIKNSKKLKIKYPNSTFFNVNISDYEEINLFFKNEFLTQQIDFIIHSAGISTSNKFFKTTKELEEMFKVKITGTMNIMKVVEILELKVEYLIFNSSLTSINGLVGAEDYAASNLFLDGLANQHFSKEKFPNFTNIISIQWPAWKTSSMFINSKLSSDLNILKNSIDVKESIEVISKVVQSQFSGVLAISNKNPLKIRKCLMEQQKEVTKNLEILEITDDSINLKSNLKNLWFSTLPMKQFSKNNNNKFVEITNETNFFHYGGNSLNGIQLIWQIESLLKNRIRIPLNWLFEFPVFKDFLEKIQQQLLSANTKDSLEQQKLQIPLLIHHLKPIPLSFPQEQMFILWNLNNETESQHFYNIIFKINLNENFCGNSANISLNSLIGEQNSLRTYFPNKANKAEYLYQEILSLTESYYFLEWKEIDEELENAIIDEETQIKYDLLNEAPFRIRTFRIKKKIFNKYIYTILLNHHHILTDGWSMSIFAKQFTRLYRKNLNPNNSSSNSDSSDSLKISNNSQKVLELSKNSKKNPITYSDYACWIRKQFNEENDYKNKCVKLSKIFDKLPPNGTRLPLDNIKEFSNISTKTNQNLEPLNYSIVLTEENNRIIAELCSKYSTTPYIIFLTAFIEALIHWRDNHEQSKIVIGSPVSGREQSQLHSIIGYFLNNIIIQLDSEKFCNRNIKEKIDFIKVSVKESKDFAEIPFHHAVANMHNRNSMNKLLNPIFQVSNIYVFLIL